IGRISTNKSPKKKQRKNQKEKNVVTRIDVGNSKARDKVAASEKRKASRQAIGESVMWAERIRRFEGVLRYRDGGLVVYSRTPTIPVVDVLVRREAGA
ncbi:unnamed protein product, partial [Heterotrigona itama]